MTTLVHTIIDQYHDLMDNKSDPRVTTWPMMSSPLPTLFICLFYAYFSRVLGPAIMENRKPLMLRRTLIYYNAFQTLFSAWIFYEYLMSGWATHYSYRCQPVDYSTSPVAMRMARTCWWYYISKFTEFFDTMFFILRKKFSQVSTLHVIHHGIMPMSVWMGMKFAPGGHSTFFALLNTFVHIVMYFYYMVSAMGPEYQKYIWWKKYLTAFQMVQFICIFIHQFQLLFVDCDYPKSFTIWIGLHGVLFLVLFSGFYKEKYVQPKSKSKSSIAANTSSSAPSVDEKTTTSQNGYIKPVSNGTAGYTKTATESACGNVYYSNGINNGFMSTKPVEGGNSSNNVVSSDTRKTK